ncbi:MAG: hypothetical protein AVDCRST_MAG12-2408, partial [uncultured Rubrobacteraceae bacterium]
WSRIRRSRRQECAATRRRSSGRPPRSARHAGTGSAGRPSFWKPWWKSWPSTWAPEVSRPRVPGERALSRGTAPKRARPG